MPQTFTMKRQETTLSRFIPRLARQFGGKKPSDNTKIVGILKDVYSLGRNTAYHAGRKTNKKKS